MKEKKLSYKYAPEFPGSQRKTINYKIESIHQKSSIVALGMNRCPSNVQGFSFSCGSSNSVCGFSGQYPYQQATINTSEHFTHPSLTSSIKGQRAGQKSSFWGVEAAGCSFLSPCSAGRFCLFWLAWPFEQHTSDEFQELGMGAAGQTGGHCAGSGSLFPSSTFRRKANASVSHLKR